MANGELEEKAEKNKKIEHMLKEGMEPLLELN